MPPRPRKIDNTVPIQQYDDQIFDNFFHVGEYSIDFQSAFCQPDFPQFRRDSKPSSFPYKSCILTYNYKIDYSPRETLDLGLEIDGMWTFKEVRLNSESLNRTLINLSRKKSKNIIFTLVSIENHTELVARLTIDIWLNISLHKEILIQNPLSCITRENSKIEEVHTLMTKFYFSLESKKCNYDSNTNKCYQKLPPEENTSNKNLFNIVHNIHQNEIKLKSNNTSRDRELIEQLFIDQNSMLKPTLRPYQINAVRWMLKRENFKFDLNPEGFDNGTLASDENEMLDELYTELVDKFSKTIYYHKFYGVYTTVMPIRSKTLTGGILADEMGLGKTLEILATILLHPRAAFSDKISFEKDVLKIERNSKVRNFSCVCGIPPASFNYYNRHDSNNKREASYQNHESGKKRKLNNSTRQHSSGCEENPVYQCQACGAWTHINCVKYKGPEETFLCLNCCTKVSLISSKCTLIVTPASIKHQWVEEIRKHVNCKLKVLIYDGCETSFIQPADLAQMDICITTYEILNSEMTHVFANENMRELRHAKRFMNVPSPLVCIEWWRICLDEAQMVHNTNSHTAEMANRLHAINRWCVTGTPIGSSITDLCGLFTFIREEPFYVQKWFNELLYFPYMENDRMPMASAVAQVLWRTAKHNVEDQINIPKQTEKIYWLNFSPFESHLYERLLEMFRQKRKQSFADNNVHFVKDAETNQVGVDRYFTKYNKDLGLDEMDRTIISQVLAPLLDLRLACDHPQLVLRKKSFMGAMQSKKDKLFTMEKAMDLMINKTKDESENFLRETTMHANALAGIHLIRGEVDKACECYQKILDSEKEFNFKIKIDNLQKIHCVHNYLYALQRKHTQHTLGEELNYQLESLATILKNSEDKYAGSFEEKRAKEELKFAKKHTEANEKFIKNLKDYEKKFINVLSSIENNQLKCSELWEKFGDMFPSTFTNQILTINQNNGVSISTNATKSVSYQVCKKTIRSITELKLLFVEETEKVISQRDILIAELKSFLKDGITSELVERSADCHLRAELTGKKKPKGANYEFKCYLCRCDKSLRDYSNQLFSNSETMNKLVSRRKRGHVQEDSDDEEPEQEVNSQRSYSDLEKLFRVVNAFVRRDDRLKEEFAVIKELVEGYELLKEEFKSITQLWLCASFQISALDELAMSKMRMRLAEPEDDLNGLNLGNLIDRKDVEYAFDNHFANMFRSLKDLKKKYGQMVYLENLAKSNSLTVNKENEEPCPICHSNLGYKWHVLQCGHSYCEECTVDLQNRNLKASITCPLCREVCVPKDMHIVTTISVQKEQQTDKPTLLEQISEFNLNQIDYINYNDNDLSNVKIKGDINSAKVEGVVRCLIDIVKKKPEDKCIVFSEHSTMLDLITELLKENGIGFKLIKNSASLQTSIQEYKRDPSINVLLMPYSLGANGLNVIEATHVVLVEPTLNRSQEVQAIGRVHRIGQTRPTTVYRFIIRNTIEELVYNLFKTGTSYSTGNQTNEPTSSSTALARSDATSDQSGQDLSKRILTIADIKDLFQNL